MDYVKLYNGVTMPLLGFGTYKVTSKESLLCAIKAGYRLIDTAQVYANEEVVGEAIKESGVPREEFFIVTKLRFRNHNDPEPIIEESFKKLGVDVIDLFLIHWPYGDYYHAYKVLEKYYMQGRIRAIGVSNFEPARLIDLWHNSQIKPMVNQVEVNVYSQRLVEKQYHDKYQVVTMAYAPLGHGTTPQLVQEKILNDIGNKHHKSGAQIAIKYLEQRGIVVIPKSSHEERIKENIDIFDFELSEEEMEQIKSMDLAKPIIGRPEDGQIAEKMYAKNE